MVDATILEKVSPEARDRLSAVAQEMQASEDDLVALVVENAFAPAIELSEEDIAETKLAIAEADVGGPFVSHDDMLAWLKALAEGKKANPPEATVYVS